jgi:toxin ParE1/3/4
MASYRLSNTAKNDLIRIHHFSVQQADIYFNKIFDHFEIIVNRPFAFEAVDFIKPGYRRCVCGSESIYYKVLRDSVVIMAIAGRQDIDNIL